MSTCVTRDETARVPSGLQATEDGWIYDGPLKQLIAEGSRLIIEFLKGT